MTQVQHQDTKYISQFTNDPGLPKRSYLGFEPILVSRILTLSWPVIIGMVTQTCINTIELLFIGRLPEEIAVPGAAAILSSLVLVWGFGGFLSAISVGTQALSARRFSEGNLKRTGQVLTNSLTVATLASLVFTVIAEYSIAPLFQLLTASKEVQTIGISFCKIRLLGLLGMCLMAAYKSFYDSIGHVKVHMTISLIMNVTNAVISYILIFGHTSMGITIEPMYVDGAAWGAVVSSYVGLVLMIIWSLRKADRQRFKVYSISNLNSKIASSVVAISIWSGFATIILMSGVGLFNYVVSMVDQDSGGGFINSSAASVIIHIMMLIFIGSLAFGTATATLVSQSIGARLPKLAERYGWQSVRLAIVAMVVVGIFGVLYPESVLHLFMPHELSETSLKNAVIAAAIPSVKLCLGLLAPAASAALVLTQALYGAGETRYVMTVEFVLHFFLLVPLAYVLAVVFDLGLAGSFTAAVAYSFCLFIATGLKFKFGAWKTRVL